MPTVKTLQGHVLDRLRELPDNSVQCVVTSPPYWGLRDYAACKCSQQRYASQSALEMCRTIAPGKSGQSSATDPRCFKDPDPNCPACHGTGKNEEVAKWQIGLEKTPAEYIEKMVEVFHEVRRVLRPDGTCWVNLGSSYYGSGCGGSDSEIQASNLASVSDDKQTIQSLQRRNGRACGNDGTKLQDSHVSDFSCFDLCDGCRDSFLKNNVRSDQLREQLQQLSEKKDRDNERLDSSKEAVTAVALSSLESTNRESFLLLPDECSHCANCGACLSVLRSSSRDGTLCVRKARNNSCIFQNELGHHNQSKDVSGMAWPYSTTMFSTYKPKDLINIPFLFSEALRANGWYLRSDIIWAKPNPMPESVQDRPTKSHEYIFLLTKTADYFYDGEPIREQVTGNAHDRGNGVNPKAKTSGKNSRMAVDRDFQHLKVPQGWDTTKREGGHGNVHKTGRNKKNESFSAFVRGALFQNRNKRTVWTVATYSYSDAHFATYPPELIRPCILAGSSAHGCCADCGAPYERIIELGEPLIEQQRACGGDLFGQYEPGEGKDTEGTKAQNPRDLKARILAGMRERKTVGWKKTCECATDKRKPCVVLDPFGGSGTTGQVAIEEGRDAILIELNPEYFKLIEDRTSQITPGLMI